MTTANDFFDMKAAPIRIGGVRLKVRDLDAVSTFYQTVLGLSPIETGDRRVALGTGETPLLQLVGDPALAPHDPRQAGLFHTAFLMPTRADLARWVAHVAEARVPLQGASDHIVSEALYLADPEGNGIEVYADRPVARWHGPKGEIRMSTDPLDVQDLLQSTEGTVWSAFPEAGSIGHVHLQVGDTAEADRFYRDVLGLDIAASYPGARFYGSGGYHHQLAGNIWNSRRAGKRPEGTAGLDAVEIDVRDAADVAAIAARAESCMALCPNEKKFFFKFSMFPAPHQTYVVISSGCVAIKGRHRL
jgi:catechol 2,3-dioxygenase